MRKPEKKTSMMYGKVLRRTISTEKIFRSGKNRLENRYNVTDCKNK
jgi:hypothetical protein